MSPITQGEIDALCEGLIKRIDDSVSASKGTSKEKSARYVRDLDWVRMAIEKRLQERLGMARSDLNQWASTFAKLPPEITLKIIDLVLADLSSGMYYPTLYRLMFVCRAFRLLIISTPTLWSLVSGGRNKELIHLALKRARNVPLSILLPSWAANDGIETILLLPTSSIRVLRVAFPEQLDEEEIDFTWPAPLLEELELIHPGRRDGLDMDFRRDDLFKGEADRLRSVKLSAVIINWKSSSLAGLTCLELSFMNIPETSEDDILAIIKLSPRLEHLGLLKISFRSRKTAPSDCALDLPNLAHFHVELSELSAIVFIQGIRAPNCAELTLNTRHTINLEDVPTFSTGLDKFDHFLPTMVRLVQASTHIGIRVTAFGLTLRTSSKTFQIVLPPLEHRCAEILSWMSNSILPLKHSIHLTITTPFDIDSQAVYDCIVKLNVVSLKFTDSANADAFIRRLDMPTGRAGWLFPSLEKLCILSYYSGPQLVNMVAGRYATNRGLHDAGRPGSQWPSKPVALELLHFGDNDDSDPYEMLDQLEDILGRDVADYVDGEDEDEDDETVEDDEDGASIGDLAW